MNVEEPIGNVVEGEYKKYSFVINEYDVKVSQKITGEKPIGTVVNLNEIKQIAVAETVELQVTGKVENGSVSKIEAIETVGITYKEDDERNSSESKIYVVSDNGTYHFRITGNTGRSYITEITVTNAAPLKKDLLTGIADVNEAGFKMIKVNGRTYEEDKTKEKEETIIYTVNVIYCDGDLILKNGSFTKNESGSQVAKTVDGLSLSGTTWSVGKAADVNTNTVVLKVNGDMTLDSGFSLIPIKSGTAVPKGLIVYCTGRLTINGNVNMNGVSCTAPGQNVYLWKNNDGSFEYIRNTGGAAGAATAYGQGYGYTYSFTSSNGTTTQVKDNHWICGGGGGARGRGSQAPGEVGTTWRGGIGGQAYTRHYLGGDGQYGRGGLGGGVLVIYGSSIDGTGTATANGNNGTQGYGVDNSTGYYCGGRRWRTGEFVYFLILMECGGLLNVVQMEVA